MVKVSRIEQDSIAESLGIQVGTELLTVNARPLADFLDWEFLTADEEILIEARLPGGEQAIYEI
jgi:S1-C subfamily serine protease